MTWEEVYTNGEYARRNPSCHVEDSPWKASQVMRMLERNHIAPNTICEVGCGAGEILKQLQERMDHESTFWGYEISPQAFELCKDRANQRLHFKLKDIRREEGVFFDLILLLDVIEHLEDYFSFLREVKGKSRYKILHIPLDLSVQALSRVSPLLSTRASYGHIHYFTKETALAVLADVGYEVLDYFYTAKSIELPTDSSKTWIAKPARNLLFAIHKDFAVRLMGGYSFMVLAK